MIRKNKDKWRGKVINYEFREIYKQMLIYENIISYLKIFLRLAHLLTLFFLHRWKGFSP